MQGAKASPGAIGLCDQQGIRLEHLEQVSCLRSSSEPRGKARGSGISLERVWMWGFLFKGELKACPEAGWHCMESSAIVNLMCVGSELVQRQTDTA